MNNNITKPDYLKEQEIIMKDERFIQINEKAAFKVSKIMDWILIGLLFFAGVYMKDMTNLFIVSIIVVVKFTLTLIYSRYYSKLL